MIQHQTSHLSVFLLLIKENKILLSRRFNTGWKDGYYTLPSGHVDLNEKIKTSMIREAREECGIQLAEEDLQFFHVMHIFTNKDYIAFFFKAEKWKGDPKIIEQDKCDDMQWFSSDTLPDKTLPLIESVLNDYKKGILFSEPNSNM